MKCFELSNRLNMGLVFRLHYQGKHSMTIRNLYWKTNSVIRTRQKVTSSNSSVSDSNIVLFITTYTLVQWSLFLNLY